MTMTEILLAAKAEGLSYGQYVLKHRPHTTFEELEDAKMLNKRRYMGESSVLVCKNCGKAFMQKQNPAQFCSHLCADAYRRTQRLGHTVVCEICGASFQTNRPRKKTCSNECARIRQQKMDRERHLAQKSAAGKASEPRACIVCGGPLPDNCAWRKYCFKEECQRIKDENRHGKKWQNKAAEKEKGKGA